MVFAWGEGMRSDGCLAAVAPSTSMQTACSLLLIPSLHWFYPPSSPPSKADSNIDADVVLHASNHSDLELTRNKHSRAEVGVGTQD